MPKTRADSAYAASLSPAKRLNACMKQGWLNMDERHHPSYMPGSSHRMASAALRPESMAVRMPPKVRGLGIAAASPHEITSAFRDAFQATGGDGPAVLLDNLLLNDVRPAREADASVLAGRELPPVSAVVPLSLDEYYLVARHVLFHDVLLRPDHHGRLGPEDVPANAGVHAVRTDEEARCDRTP